MKRLLVLVMLVSFTVLTGCPDDGQRVLICENPDLNCDDSNACTADSCDPSLGCVNQRIDCGDGDACTVDSCNPALGCANTAIICNDSNACTADSCDASIGCVSTDISADCNDSNACTADSCSPATGCVNAAINCADTNECTAESCVPATGCDSRPVADGTSCDSGLGQCVDGACELFDCFNDAGCNDGNACTADTCNLASNECVNADISASCDDGNLCTADSCDPATGCVNADSSASCDDEEDCTADSCDPATGCSSDPVADGTSCEGGSGVCASGVCMSLNLVEYLQDFESLVQTDVSALGNDDWLVYGNVFEAGTQAFLYGYGPNPAPNDGGAFSAISIGQGGPEQGDQQLSVYSDYKNADHANGHTIESIVYRERSITAADVGRTITFSFDAKRGNINDPFDPLCPCSSKAFAFIKTLNPSAGFVTTNLVQEETTALPEGWARYAITLPIDAGLVDQLLQVGFTSMATLYQPSANFYDNVEVRSAPTLP
jgi:hypothetical protein